MARDHRSRPMPEVAGAPPSAAHTPRNARRGWLGDLAAIVRDSPVAQRKLFERPVVSSDRSTNVVQRVLRFRGKDYSSPGEFWSEEHFNYAEEKKINRGEINHHIKIPDKIFDLEKNFAVIDEPIVESHGIVMSERVAKPHER